MHMSVYLFVCQLKNIAEVKSRKSGTYDLRQRMTAAMAFRIH